MLVAFIFLVVFAALGFGIYFLYEKFLSSDASSTEFSSLASESSPKKGQMVDIVIEDEDLPFDNNTNRYYVGTNHFMLNSEDLTGGKEARNSSPAARTVKQSDASDSFGNFSSLGAGDGVGAAKKDEPASTVSSKPVDSVKPNSGASVSAGEKANESPSAKEFVPVRNLETLYKTPEKESVIKSEQTSEESESSSSPAPSGNTKNFAAIDDQIDSLPSLDDYATVFNNEDDSQSSLGDQDLNGDSDFATGKDRPNRIEPDIKDAELMAKAISTILSSER